MNAVGHENAPGLNTDDAGVFEGVEFFNQLMAQAVNGEGKAPLGQYDSSLAHGRKGRVQGGVDAFEWIVFYSKSHRIFLLNGLGEKKETPCFFLLTPNHFFYL